MIGEPHHRGNLDTKGNLMDVAQGLLILVLVVVVYFAPSLIAANRNVPNTGSVFVINLFLGWTLVGWVVALAMAARSVPGQEVRRQDSQAERQDPFGEIARRSRKTS